MGRRSAGHATNGGLFPSLPPIPSAATRDWSGLPCRDTGPILFAKIGQQEAKESSSQSGLHFSPDLPVGLSPE